MLLQLVEWLIAIRAVKTATRIQRKKSLSRDQYQWPIQAIMSLKWARIEKRKDVAFKTKSVIRSKQINNRIRNNILVCLGQSSKQSMTAHSFQPSKSKLKLKNTKTHPTTKTPHQLIQIRMKEVVPAIHKTLTWPTLILKISLNRNMTIWSFEIKMYW